MTGSSCRRPKCSRVYAVMDRLLHSSSSRFESPRPQTGYTNCLNLRRMEESRRAHRYDSGGRCTAAFAGCRTRSARCLAAHLRRFARVSGSSGPDNPPSLAIPASLVEVKLVETAKLCLLELRQPIGRRLR